MWPGIPGLHRAVRRDLVGRGVPYVPLSQYNTGFEPLLDAERERALSYFRGAGSRGVGGSGEPLGRRAAPRGHHRAVLRGVQPAEGHTSCVAVAWWCRVPDGVRRSTRRRSQGPGRAARGPVRTPLAGTLLAPDLLRRGTGPSVAHRSHEALRAQGPSHVRRATWTTSSRCGGSTTCSCSRPARRACRSRCSKRWPSAGRRSSPMSGATVSGSRLARRVDSLPRRPVRRSTRRWTTSGRWLLAGP